MNDQGYVKLTADDVQKRLNCNYYSVASGAIVLIDILFIYFFIVSPINIPYELKFINGIVSISVILLTVGNLLLALYARYYRKEDSYRGISSFVLFLHVCLLISTIVKMIFIH